MASIRDYNVVEQFNSRLEEIRTKLLDQAMAEVLNDRAAELCQEHRQYMKSVLGKRSTESFCGCHHGLSLDGHKYCDKQTRLKLVLDQTACLSCFN